MLPRTESTVLRNEERIAERDDRKQTGLARQTTVWPPGDGPGMCFTMICCFAPHKFGRGRFWSWLCDNALVRCVFFALTLRGYRRPNGGNRQRVRLPHFSGGYYQKPPEDAHVLRSASTRSWSSYQCSAVIVD